MFSLRARFSGYNGWLPPIAREIVLQCLRLLDRFFYVCSIRLLNEARLAFPSNLLNEACGA